MLFSGTVVADPNTVLAEGAVVTEGRDIAFVGGPNDAVDRYPAHDRRPFDVVPPGFVEAHVHSVQSLGRGIADDDDLMAWLSDHVLPLEANLVARRRRSAPFSGTSNASRAARRRCWTTRLSTIRRSSSGPPSASGSGRASGRF